MKNKTILIIILCVSGKLASAQISLGINAGATFPSYKVTDNSVSLTSDIKVGFTAGATVIYAFNEDLSLFTGLNFLQKGGSLNVSSSNITHSSTYNYLDLPLNVVYNFHMSGGKIFIGAGPTFDLGLSGTYKITGMYEESGSIHFGSSADDDLKPFELGLNFLAGYEFGNGILISGNYNFGLNNIAPDQSATFHNRYFSITIGYLFLK